MCQTIEKSIVRLGKRTHARTDRAAQVLPRQPVVGDDVAGRGGLLAVGIVATIIYCYDYRYRYALVALVFVYVSPLSGIIVIIIIITIITRRAPGRTAGGGRSARRLYPSWPPHTLRCCVVAYGNEKESVQKKTRACMHNVCPFVPVGPLIS